MKGGKKCQKLKTLLILVQVEKYINEEKVEVSKLAKELRVTYSSARNYLLRFLEEELGVTTNLKYYNYKKQDIKKYI